MPILITGATGFVVSNLTRHLLDAGHDVVAADLVEPDEPLRRFLGGLRGSVSYRRLDVRDPAAVRALVAEIRPEHAVHGAALTSVPEETERRRFLETTEVNVVGTLQVLEALREAGARRTVVVSSGSVYGPRPDLHPIVEDDPGNPQALYPITKWSADLLARRFADVHQLDLAVVRLASPFGPFERDTGSRPLLSPIRTWTVAALRGDSVELRGPSDLPRDVVHVADVASGIAAVLLADRLPHGVYNVGWGRSATAEQVLTSLGRLIPGLRVDHRPDEPSPWLSTSNALRGPLSVDRLRTDLGWSPRYDLDSGLAAYVDWLRTMPPASYGD